MSFKNAYIVKKHMGGGELYYDCKYDCIRLFQITDQRRYDEKKYIKLD